MDFMNFTQWHNSCRLLSDFMDHHFKEFPTLKMLRSSVYLLSYILASCQKKVHILILLQSWSWTRRNCFNYQCHFFYTCKQSINDKNIILIYYKITYVMRSLVKTIAFSESFVFLDPPPTLLIFLLGFLLHILCIALQETLQLYKWCCIALTLAPTRSLPIQIFRPALT